MNSQSALQQQFPLSPKKYWKKMIDKLLVFYILEITIAVFYLIAISLINNPDLSVVLLVILIAGILFLIVLTPFYSWYIKVYIKRYYYDGEEHFITIKKGVFAPTEIHVQWQKIQDVYVDQDILDRVMGLYDVHIASATASSGIEAHIDGVDQAAAEGLKQFLLTKVSGAGRNSSIDISQAKVNDHTQTTNAQVSTINLSEDISNKTYPLSNKWMAITLISRLIGSFVLPAIIIFFLFIKANEQMSSDDWVYLILGWLAFGILVSIVRTIALFLWKKNYAFNFTSEHIYYKEGVISLSEKHMPYSSIQDVTVRQGIIERLLGLASVVIENAAQQALMVGSNGQQMSVFSGVILQGISISDANKITNVLKTTVLGRNSSRHGL